MKIAKNVTVYAGGDESVQQRLMAEKLEKAQKAGQDKGKVSVFAGQLGLGKDPIAEKKQQARQKALKVVADTISSDREIDNEIQKHRDRAAQLQKEMETETDTMNTIRRQEKQMQAAYGVEDGSQEQQDAELLMKEQEGRTLTKEERERLSQIQEEGLSEYQTNLLTMHKDVVDCQRKMDSLQGQAAAEWGTVKSMRLKKLEHDPMVQANQQAEEIMEAAGKEIIGMLVEEGKEHLEEENEERKEEAEEIKEQKEEQEERIEKRKEDREELEELTEEILSGDASGTGKTQEELQQELKNIVNEMKLLEEDLKGAAVDETL